MMVYTYVLLSEVDKKFYIGFAKDLEKRLAEHESGIGEETCRARERYGRFNFSETSTEADLL